MRIRSVWAIIGLSILCVLILDTPYGRAADPNPGSLTKPPDSDFKARPALPPYDSPKTDRDLELPPLPTPKSDDNDIARGLRVYVNAFHFTGNTVFTQQQLQELAAPYTHRTITSEKLHELRHRLTLFYVNQGYLNSGVIIPDQKVKNGVITLQVIEGRLSDIRIRGTQRLKPGYIEKRLALGTGPPLNINDLQTRIQLLDQDPLIRRIRAVLSPGIRRGEAVLEAEVTEAVPWQTSFSFSNHRTPSTGEYYGKYELYHRNLTGHGDVLGGAVGGSRGGPDYLVSYALPITPRDTKLEFSFERSDLDVIEAPFNQLDITSRSETLRMAFSHPLFKTPSWQWIAELSAEKRHSDTFLLGYPYSFSPGVYDGETDIAVIRLSQSWLIRSRYQVIALRAVLSQGIDFYEATRNDSGPDAIFFAFLGQFQLARRFEALHNTQAVFRIDAQFTPDPLFPMEKFSVGGAGSVRGYRENQIVSDNAAVASMELRIPLLRLPIPGLTRGPADGILQLAPFYDWGWADDHSEDTQRDFHTISSLGCGLRYDPSSQVHGEVYVGHPFRDLNDNAAYSHQGDLGVHFKFSIDFL